MGIGRIAAGHAERARQKCVANHSELRARFDPGDHRLGIVTTR